MLRQDWNSYFIDLCNVVATRATCDRRHCGAVLVKDNRVISTGYNGSLPGMPHCDDVGHLMENGHCVSGDTAISKFQGRHYNSQHKTIKEIHDMWHSRWRFMAKKIKVRSVNENGVIVPGAISNVWSNGVQDVHLVKTRLSKSIKATISHKFLTPNGWVELASLKEGDLIALNVQNLCEDAEWLHKQYIKENKTQLAIAALVGCSRGTIRRHLLKNGIRIRAFKLGGWNRGFVRNQNHSYKGDYVYPHVARARSRRYKLSHSDQKCEVCGEHKEEIHVHHIDRNPYNDTLSNLLALCIECHSLVHSQHPNRQSIVFDKVQSITCAGQEEVFDLSIEPHHNFVGNSIILHNCVRVVHSEVNAIAQAAKMGICTNGAVLYCNTRPCWNCLKTIIAAGITEVVYQDEYRTEEVDRFASEIPGSVRVTSIISKVTNPHSHR